MYVPLHFSANVLDLQGYVNMQASPAEMRDRSKQCWLVRQRPVDTGHQGEFVKNWSVCRTDEYVRIPLMPYMSKCDDPSVLVGYAMELMGRLQHELTHKYGYTIQGCHLSIGSPVEAAELEGRPVLRTWLGFAFSIKEVNNGQPATLA